MAILFCKDLQLFLLKTRHKYCSVCLYSKKIKDEGNSSIMERTKNKISDATSTPKDPLRIEDLEEPTNCCMSGCQNCVWIEHAEKLNSLLKNSPDEIQKLIMEKIQDPNMRAFLAMELRGRKLID